MRATTVYKIDRWIPGEKMNPPSPTGEFWRLQAEFESIEKAREFVASYPEFRHAIIEVLTVERQVG